MATETHCIVGASGYTPPGGKAWCTGRDDGQNAYNTVRWAGRGAAHESRWRRPESIRQHHVSDVAIGWTEVVGVNHSKHSRRWSGIAAIRTRVHRHISPPAPHSIMRWDSVSVCPQQLQRSLSEMAILLRRSLVGSMSWSTIYHVERTVSWIQAVCRFRHIRDQS